MIKTFEKPDCPGYVILGRTRSSNGFVGIVENSFSMDTHPERACFFWSGKATDNVFGATWEIDGKKNAEEHLQVFEKRHPDIEWAIFDVHAEDLPVILDWDDWRDGNSYSEKTLSGVKNKFRARNVRFFMPE